MNNKNKGFVLLWRKIQDNPLWLKEPFTRGQAWVDLFLLANHKDNIIIIRGNIVNVKRGQLGWAIETLGERWKWSFGKVKRYLLYLQMVGQIEVQKSNIISLITVKNYEDYQKDRRTEQSTDSSTDGGQIAVQTAANNNGNNINNDKKCRFTPPTIQEISFYITSMGYHIDPQYFLDKQEERGWELKNGKKIKDWKATVRTWEKKQKEWEQPKYKDIYEEITYRLEKIFTKDSNSKIGNLSVGGLFSEFSQYNNDRDYYSKVVEELSKNQSFINKLRQYV